MYLTTSRPYALQSECVTFMEGRIDPPSSLTRMTPGDIRAAAIAGEVWIIEDADALIASLTLTPKPDCLYLGKPAVSRDHHGKGLARRLLAQAEDSARRLGNPVLRLETRVECTENCTTVFALGFRKTGQTAHPGFDRPTSITMEKPVPLRSLP